MLTSALVPKHQAYVVLFCTCGWQVELFNGELGACKNPRCAEHNRIYEVAVTVLPVKENYAGAVS